MLGLDAAGKTSELLNINNIKLIETNPTYESLFSNTLQAEAWAIGHNHSHGWLQC